MFAFLNHDLTEPLFLEEEVDVVFHLASPASPIDYQRLPLHTLKVGSYGTHNMLGLATFKRARFFLASTRRCTATPRCIPAGDVLGARESDRPAGRLRACAECSPANVSLPIRRDLRGHK